MPRREVRELPMLSNIASRDTPGRSEIPQVVSSESICSMLRFRRKKPTIASVSS